MYLVTGGTGFVGCYVVRDLLTADKDVTIFDFSPDLKMLNLIAGPTVSQRTQIVRGDITQPGQLFAAMHEHRPDVIIHLASPVPPETELDATVTLQKITKGTVNVLEAGRIFGVRKVVFASASSSVFGPAERHGGDIEVPNDAPHYPESLYGIGKSANERLAAFYWKRFNLDTLGLRFCQGYGPTRRGRPFWPFGDNIFENIFRGLPIRVPFGDDVVNLQYVEEMSAVTVQASSVPPTQNRVFNTTGEVLPVRKAVEILSGLAPDAHFEMEGGKTGLLWRFDVSRLEQEVGFRSRISAAEGLRRTLTTLRAWESDGVW